MTIERRELRDGALLAELTEDHAAPGATAPVAYVRGDEGVTVQLAGSATSIRAIVERATRDPNEAGAVNWAPAEAEAIEGDLTAGIPPRTYTEPARGFWRVRIAEIAGGTVTIAMVGEIR